MNYRFFLLFFFTWGVGYFAQKQTDGFTISKISNQFIHTHGIPLNEALLMQPYIYHGKGGQSYVFFSQDGEYVLKCFRSSKVQTFVFLHRIFPFSFFEKRKMKQTKLIQQTLEGYLLAFEEFSAETALLGVHLDQNIFLTTPLKIIDKLGISHTIDPNQISFVIQKKAILVKDKIGQKMQESGLSGTKQILRALFSLLKDRMEKGIEDIDANLTKNFGFIGDEPVQIDSGGFSKKTSPSLGKILKSAEDLQHWINAHYPTLSKDYRMLLEEYFCEEI